MMAPATRAAGCKWPEYHLLDKGHEMLCLERLLFGKQVVADIMQYPRFAYIGVTLGGLTLRFLKELICSWIPTFHTTL